MKLNDENLRQGDVNLVRVNKLPPNMDDVTPKTGRVVLMHGEATGHAHAFYDGGVSVYRSPKSKSDRPDYLRVVETAYLKHEEHTEAKVPPGLYRITTQVEHTDDDEPIVVAD